MQGILIVRHTRHETAIFNIESGQWPKFPSVLSVSKIII